MTKNKRVLWIDNYLPSSYIFGTCIESLKGGNHIRAWQQQGTGAWFFAASKEENVTKHHMIVPNGYNIGRDDLVQQSQKNKNGITYVVMIIVNPLQRLKMLTFVPSSPSLAQIIHVY